MDILNEDLNWDDLPKNVRNAFPSQFGPPTKELLSKDMVLYRLHDYPGLPYALPQWWSPYGPYKNDGGYVQRVALAELFGVSFRELVRVTSAVSEDWSKLKYELTVELAKDVYGWHGGFSSQERLVGKDRSKKDQQEKRGVTRKLPGGGTQFFIPNLTLAHIKPGKYSLTNVPFGGK